MRQYLTAAIQAISKSELDSIIEPLVLRHIKENDPNPEIRVYSIGHEGKSNLHLPGIGNKTFTWIQAAVQWIADKLRIGTAVFDRHDPNTNSQIGRIQIGEVIGKSVKKIGDRLNTLAAIHIFPQYKSRPFDVASIEAEIEYDHNSLEAWPVNINSVTGIALSNSGIDQPGFPGATLLGAVQAYVQAFGSDIGVSKMNQSEVKQAVKELGLKPSQVFDVNDIIGDSAVVEKMKEDKKDLWGASERFKQERDEARARIAKLENEKADTEKKLQQHTVQSKSASMLEAILTDPARKLDDKTKTFVKRNLKNFSTTAADEDALKAELGKFVDSSVKEYGELAKDVFGVVADTAIPPATFKIPPEFLVNNQQSQQQSVVKTPVTREEVLREEMNPNINPLIPGGKAALEAQKA